LKIQSNPFPGLSAEHELLNLTSLTFSKSEGEDRKNDNTISIPFDPLPPVIEMGGRGTLAWRAREEREGWFSGDEYILWIGTNVDNPGYGPLQL
jgi:hypothetical protein